jgi:hypothetical protein
MTTHFESTKTCSLCGEQSQHMELGSTNAFGACDLDTRPPPMQRYTMDTWVQRCPHCGLCARDLEAGAAEDREAIQSPAYLAKLANTDLPELATRFICQAHLEHARGQTRDAGWTLITAAWVCDDAAEQDSAATGGARRCREFAIELLEAALGEPGFEDRQAGLTQLVLVDLARRAERFEQATKFLDQAAALTTEETLVSMVALQRSLIAERDSKCYSLEALSGPAG